MTTLGPIATSEPIGCFRIDPGAGIDPDGRLWNWRGEKFEHFGDGQVGIIHPYHARFILRRHFDAPGPTIAPAACARCETSDMCLLGADERQLIEDAASSSVAAPRMH